MAKLRTLQVTAELLSQVLCLPEGTKVEDVRFVSRHNLFELRLTNPDFAEAPGAPMVGVRFHQDRHACPDDNSVWFKTVGEWYQP